MWLIPAQALGVSTSSLKNRRNRVWASIHLRPTNKLPTPRPYWIIRAMAISLTCAHETYRPIHNAWRLRCPWLLRTRWHGREPHRRYHPDIFIVEKTNNDIGIFQYAYPLKKFQCVNMLSYLVNNTLTLCFNCTSSTLTPNFARADTAAARTIEFSRMTRL